MSTCKLVNYPWLTVLQMKPNGRNRQPIYHLYPKTWVDELETTIKIIIIILTGPKDKCMNHIVLLVPLIPCIRISPRSSDFFFNDVDPFLLSTALELVVPGQWHSIWALSGNPCNFIFLKTFKEWPWRSMVTALQKIVFIYLTDNIPALSFQFDI